MKRRKDRFTVSEYLLFAVVTAAVLCLCVCVGSVSVPLKDAFSTFLAGARHLFGLEEAPTGFAASILLAVRLPRVLCVALVGASLSLAGATMQGLLKNPLADGSTLGVSSGAALGDRKSTCLNSSHTDSSRMPSSA